jgi:hypothetical protein
MYSELIFIKTENQTQQSKKTIQITNFLAKKFSKNEKTKIHFQQDVLK